MTNARVAVSAGAAAHRLTRGRAQKRRRDISKELVASSTGSVLISQRTEAQTCSAPCYARTPAEIAAGVTPTNLAYTPDPNIDVRRYGAAQSNTNAQNLTAINTAITVAQHAAGAS